MLEEDGGSTTTMVQYDCQNFGTRCGQPLWCDVFGEGIIGMPKLPEQR